MKTLIKIIVLLLIAPLLNAQNTNEKNDFAKSIVEAFKAKEYSRYQKLIVTQKNYYDEIMPELKKDTIHHIPDSLTEKGNDFYRNNSLDTLNKVLFYTIKEDGLKLGVTNWEKIEFNKYEDDAPEATKGDNKNLSGHIWITCGGKMYILYDVEAIKLSIGYRLLFIRGIMKEKP